MTTRHFKLQRRGFTLMELLVAMTVTTIIVAVLVSITGTAIDTWNRGRAELRAARQAKAMVDVMANDFESFVSRNMVSSEWLSAEFERTDGNNSNASYLVFFTAATDRYEGQVGVEGEDLGGDVSCVGYRLQWKDPIGVGTPEEYGTFVLNRFLVDPKPTFDTLLGRDDGSTLAAAFENEYGGDMGEDRNFLCENIYQFTVTFVIEAYHQEAPGDPAVLYTVPVSVGSSEGMTESFRIMGDGILIPDVGSMQAVADTPLTEEELQAGRLSSVEVSITVMSDNAVNLWRRGSAPSGEDELAAWIAKNTYNYSKLVLLPKM